MRLHFRRNVAQGTYAPHRALFGAVHPSGTTRMAKGSPRTNGTGQSQVKGVGRVNGGHPVNRLFSDIAQITSHEVGRAWVFVLAVVTIVVWAISGPFFGFSDTWQLVINTGTTIVTFLMVFLIQNAQNRDAAAIQVKLNELIRVSKVNNSFVGLERLTDDEIEEIRAKCEARAKAGLAHPLSSKKPNGEKIAP
jgi:low affinity Fe/Cu permease